MQVVPGFDTILSGDVVVQPRDVDIHDLLSREAVRLDGESVGHFLRGRVVMVTGAAGSIGSEICCQTLAFVGVIAAADAGVTWAVNGVALEGAMLEVVFDDSAKLASSLPIVHIALLDSSSILRDLAEAMPLVGGIVGEAPSGRKPIISFISGPSKTGDIEMRLLYGVHGPHTVHAFILDWP